jgi:hypothetical protein
VIGNIFLAFDFDLDAEQFKGGVKEGNTHAGAVGPTATENAPVEHVRETDNEQTDCDIQIVENCANKSHNNPYNMSLHP